MRSISTGVARRSARPTTSVQMRLKPVLAPTFRANPDSRRPDSCAAMSSGPPPSGLRISVVTPCVSMFTASWSPLPRAWLWRLTKPGVTKRPRTSTSASASDPARSPIRAMKPSITATSATKRGPPLPSSTVPPRRMTSYRACRAEASAGLIPADVVAMAASRPLNESSRAHRRCITAPPGSRALPGSHDPGARPPRAPRCLRRRRRSPGRTKRPRTSAPAPRKSHAR